MNEIKTFADFAKRFPMVLCNNLVNLDGFYESFYESHTCDAQDAERELETLKEGSKRFNEIIEEYGENPACECEVYQWYVISISGDDVEYYNETFGLDIFYFETLDVYVLPVFHFGTAWDYVPLNPIK
jgi:predicted CopG family antitoxin